MGYPCSESAGFIVFASVSSKKAAASLEEQSKGGFIKALVLDPENVSVFMEQRPLLYDVLF